MNKYQIAARDLHEAAKVAHERVEEAAKASIKAMKVGDTQGAEVLREVALERARLAFNLDQRAAAAAFDAIPLNG